MSLTKEWKSGFYYCALFWWWTGNSFHFGQVYSIHVFRLLSSWNKKDDIRVKKIKPHTHTFLYAPQRRDVLCYYPWWAGGVPHSLSGAYLQDYASYGYETSWVDRSHQGGVQCRRTITLTCLIFELLPFVCFHIWILSGTYLQNYTSYGYEILWVDRSHQWGVQCTGTITLAYLSF